MPKTFDEVPLTQPRKQISVIQEPTERDYPMALLEQPITTVFIEGHRSKWILDTGSQVTCLSEAFCKKFLPTLPVKPLSDLRVVSAAGQEVPYQGYVELHLRFPSETAEKEFEGTTVALICPGTQERTDVPLLVGTDTSIFRGMLHRCKTEGGRRFFVRHRVDSAWTTVLNDALSSGSGIVGVVRSSRKSPTLVMPGQELTVPGHFRNKKREEFSVRDSITNLPKGLTVRTKVIVVNNFPEVLVLPPRCRLATVSYIVQKSPVTKSPNPEKLDLTSSFEGSPLSEEKISRVQEKLQAYKDVFSRNDLGIGCTGTVKHKINLSDDTPFREVCRRIPPSDYEDTRKHPRDLQGKGIIRE